MAARLVVVIGGGAVLDREYHGPIATAPCLQPFLSNPSQVVNPGCLKVTTSYRYLSGIA